MDGEIIDGSRVTIKLIELLDKEKTIETWKEKVVANIVRIQILE